MADTPNSSNGLKRARSSSPVNGAGGNDNGNGGKKQNTGRDGGSPEEAGAVSESSSARRGGHDAAVMDSNNNAGEAAAAAAHSASGMPSGSDATAAAASAAPPITIRALIVTQDASIIIGKAGSHIKEIREKAGAKVSVTEAQQGNPERVLLVTGPLDAVSKAYGLIVRKINDEPYDQPSVPGSRAVTIKYLVPNNRMGSVIGKAGSKIKEIQEASGARLQASEGMLPGSTDRVLSVSGVADAIHIAVYYVGTILQETPDRVSATASTAYRPASTAYTPGAASAAGSYGAPASSRQPPGAYFPPGANVPYGGGAPAAYGAPAGGAFSPGGGLAGNQTQQLYIPNELVGNIIGKGGQKINEIRQMSNCSIKIMESTDSQGAGARGNERLVTITGQPHCIATAIQMLHQRLESEKAKKMQAGAY